MKKILYVGNKLESKKVNISAIHTLGASLEKEGFEVYYSSSKTNKLARLLDMIWSCLTLSRKVDFVLIDTYSTLNFYYAFIISQLCRILRLKYITILHGGNLPNRLKQNPRLSSRIFNNAYKNVSPSLYLVDEFKNQGFIDVVYIPNAIEISKYPFLEKEYSSAKLLWVRSFSEIYNPSLAIHIFKELKDQDIKTKLCMVGPDSDGSVEKIKQLANDFNLEVTFTGKLTKEAWIDLSKEFNIFLNTTNFDNMPVSVIEAMALGLCVVSTNVGGLPYLINNNEDGLLVPPNDKTSFVDSIKKVIDNPSAIKAMTTKARKKVEAYDWQIVRLKWHEVLR
ncbi:glycosyltransferase family 4 protein [Lacinutrix iliipiscaria]|uniref:Glycosyltransferase family 4 protein n=1 Tax=Lacinutrix iliipiscaria TaxID=1230532 RepID=A0ABW5WQ81_9FLAO